jgi:hypothetical protein
MKKIETYSTLSGTTSFDFAVENTSCSGGTITNICSPAAESDSNSATYILTLKELTSCSGFEDISIEQAEVVIQSLSQLSALSYQVLINE